MGLKTTNYTTKKTNVLLPEAYAILRTLVVEKDSSARAVFAIQNSRESATVNEPLEKVEVNFIWDRKADLASSAYEAAKTQKREIETDGEITVEYGSLYNWENDY
jgi:hypothetical protein